MAGVVGSVKQYGLDNRRTNGPLLPALAEPVRAACTWWRAPRRTRRPISAALIREIHAVDGDVPVYDMQTMEGRLHDSLARQRFSMTMLGAFARLR